MDLYVDIVDLIWNKVDHMVYVNNRALNYDDKIVFKGND